MAEDIATPAPEQQPATLAKSLGALSPRQYVSLIVAAAGIVAVVVGLWIWGQTPDYRVLYSNLSDRDGGAIIDALQQQNIPYKFSEGGGALMVPADKVHEIRLRLASQGLPKGGTPGFELMENEKFGTSQFLEQVNYQRALEGELARSIQTLAAVQGARVHLALPKPSVFVKEQLKPSASVVLTLYPGRVLDSGQINGIIHLISSSVADMSAKNVTVLDQTGNLLSPNKENSDTPLDPNQIQYVRQIEQDYAKRIEAIVIPLVGAGNVHTQVTADIDFSQAEQTAEMFSPNQPPNEAAVRSMQTVESSSRSGSSQTPTGVPGALSNQPPTAATAPIVAPASSVAAATSSNDTHREATTNYEVDRTIRYTKLPVGSIKRLSVAVLVNNRTVTDKSGKTTSKPLSDDEREQITALVKGAMGFSANRGDVLNVMNSAFKEEEAEPAPPELPLWKQPEMLALGKDVLKYLIIAGIGLYLVFGVIRPAFRNFENARKREEERLEEERQQALERHAMMTGQQDTGYDISLQSVKQLAQNDPKVVAAVVKEWVAQE